MIAVVCGLDVHKELTYATVLDHEGQGLLQRKMPNEDARAPRTRRRSTITTMRPLNGRSIKNQMWPMY